MGPLHGIRIVEFAGLGPGPLAATLLTDLGATVLRIERRDESARLDAALLKFDIVRRGRSAISLDLKSPTELALALSLIERADALIEGFRPGVMERMGLGPDLCLKHNARLVYCRMTGWGQTADRRARCHWPRRPASDTATQPAWRLWRWFPLPRAGFGCGAFRGPQLW